jgi:dihydrofolate synthase / folylpolyglutamate synthase
MEYNEVIKHIYSIAKTAKYAPRGEYGHERMKYLMNLLGNPQEQYQVVHIAGTSGKGSTATILSHLFESQGLKTGLHVSPHLIEIRERMQVQNTFLPKQDFVTYYEQISTVLKKMEKSFFGPATYYETLMALSYYAFAQQKVDVAVVEVGCGGLLDGSNCVQNQNKISVLTRAGYDHEEVVGYTLPEIIFQDCGIVPKNGTVIVTEDNDTKQYYKYFLQGKNVRYVSVQKHCSNIVITPKNTLFTYHLGDIDFQVDLALKGTFQIENTVLALTTFFATKDRLLRSANVDIPNIQSKLATITFPGRYEEKYSQSGGLIVFDGAHNPQKITSLLDTLITYYPDQKISFIFSFKEGKNIVEMLKSITPIASHLYITDFSKFSKSGIAAVSTDFLEKELANMGFSNFSTLHSFNDIQHIIESYNNSIIPLVITGSLYFLAAYYGADDEQY